MDSRCKQRGRAEDNKLLDLSDKLALDDDDRKSVAQLAPMAEDREKYLREFASQIADRSKPAMQRLLMQIEHPGFKEICKTRLVPSVPEPLRHKPRDEQFYFTDTYGNKRPNAEFLRQHFLKEGRITEEQTMYLLREAKDAMMKEPNLLSLQGPITIIGDIHGQYYDLMKVFDIGGDIASNTYLFLGDYVDRGVFGIEVILYLYSLKISYPDRIYLLRGNHECRSLTEYFSFKLECMRKYSLAIYMACIESFRALPLAAVVDRRFFCVHGGISPELILLDDINKINRFLEPPSHGLLCDLLWADPAPDDGKEPGVMANSTEYPSFLPNAERGCSFSYTYDAVCNFLERNGLLCMIRGHEVQKEGFRIHRKTRAKEFPSIITIFSAPNYCDAIHNRAAVLKYDKNIMIRQFSAKSHPFWCDNFMDAFTWSFPYIGYMIVKMLLGILSVCTEEELGESTFDDEGRTVALVKATETEAAIQERRQAIRNKILSVSRMERIFKQLREETENASEFSFPVGGLGQSDMHARGVADTDNELHLRGYQIKRSMHSFEDARRINMANERMPEIQFYNDGDEFPNLQAPSTRPRSPGMSDDGNLEAKPRKTLSEADNGTYETERKLHRLSDKLARTRG